MCVCKRGAGKGAVQRRTIKAKGDSLSEICFPPPWPFSGGNFSRTSPVSECLGSKALTVLSLDFLFKDVGITVLKDSVFLQSKGQACLLPTQKDSGFLSSEFLSCNETTELSGIHLGPST